jgi:WD40 repeat protein
VSGGSDHKVISWCFKDNKFEKMCEIGSHDDWVRDVAWCNNVGLLHETVASCSEDKLVKIWRKENHKDEKWEIVKELKFEYPVWKVSWS